MQVITTIPLIVSESECIKSLDACRRNGINNFRINTAKIKDISSFEKIERIYNLIKEKQSDSTIAFDIPFPGRNVRLYFENMKMTANKNECITFQNINRDKPNYIDVQDCSKVFLQDRYYYYQDGILKLSVAEVEKEYVTFMFNNNCQIRSGKAISCRNSTDTVLDQMIVKCINSLKPDALWLSFVEDTSFISDLKRSFDYEPQLFMKIETMEGIRNLDNIIKVADGIVNARGDLALNVPIKDFLDVQRIIAAKTKACFKKICFATGYLDSLYENSFPSRSDLTDLLFAYELGCDSIMLNAPLFYPERIERVISVIKECWNM